MHWWGESQKVKSAEQIINYYQSNRDVRSDEYQGQLDFVRDSKGSVDHIRKTLWPNRKNPSRRSIRNGGREIRLCSRMLLPPIRLMGVWLKADLGATLVEYYRTEYPKMNWRIHSGVAAFWNRPPQSYNLVSGFAFKWCADFGMLCAKIALTDFGFASVMDGLRDQVGAG